MSVYHNQDRPSLVVDTFINCIKAMRFHVVMENRFCDHKT